MTTEKIVYFVRHAESDANDKYIFQAPDDPLTEKGLAQCHALAKRLKRVPFDALLTSPFERARRTAEAVAGVTGHTVEADTLWREYVPPKSLLGEPRDTARGEEYMRERRAHIRESAWHFEDEENYHDLHRRATEALQSLNDRPEKTIVVVTHLGFLKAVLTNMLMRGVPAPEVYVRMRFLFESKNTGITTCRYGTDKKGRAGWRLLTWNNFDHLSDELASLSEPLGAR